MSTGLLSRVILIKAIVALSLWGHGCSKANESLVSSSSMKESLQAQLIESIREDGISYEYTAIFSGSGPSDIAIRMDCADRASASRVLGIDPTTIQAITLEELALFQEKPLIHISQETVKGPGSLGLSLSCQPDLQGDAWNIFVTTDSSKILLALDQSKGRYLSFSSTCEGLKSGFEIPRLFKDLRTEEIMISPEKLGIKEEYSLGCGTFKAINPSSKSWSLAYTDEFEVFLIDRSAAEVTALQIKALDKASADRVAEQLLFPDSDEAALNESIVQLKDLMGIDTVENFATASEVPGVIANVKLDLCAQTCKGSFEAEHFIGESEVASLQATQDRDVEGNLNVDWKYLADQPALRFKQCGNMGLQSLLGLRIQNSDWTNEVQSSQWIKKVQEVAKQGEGVKSISCLKESTDVCRLPPILKPTLASKAKLNEFLSLDSCKNKNAKVIELRLRSQLILDAQSLDLNLAALRAKTQNTELNTIRIIGETPAAAIVSRLSCSNGRLSCPAQPPHLLPAIRVQSGVQLELRGLSIDRETAVEANHAHVGIESLAGGRLLLDRVRLLTTTKTFAFDIGVRMILSKASIIDSDIVAAQIGVDVNDSKLVIFDSEKDQKNYISTKVLELSDKKIQFPITGDPTLDTSGHRANIQMTGQQSALFVRNQNLLGSTALRTAGKATAQLNEVGFFGPGQVAGRQFQMIRDDNGSASISLIGGRIYNYDYLLYLLGDGTNFSLAFPEVLQLNSCGEDSVGKQFAFLKDTHVGGVKQANPINIKVNPRDNRCENAL